MAVEENKNSAGTTQPTPMRQLALSMDVGSIYANGSNVATTSTEMQITFVLNARPAIMVIMPFSLAKSMVTAITNAIKDHEKTTGSEILTLDELRNLKNK